MLQGQHHLDQPRHPRRRLGMADIGLNRPHQQRPLRRTGLPQNRRQRPHLNRITQSRPRAVRLHIPHLGRRHPATRQRRPHHRLLSRAVRRGQPVRTAVLVDRRATDHRQHPVPVGLRIRQPLQHHHPAALTPHVTVRPGIERLAPAIRSHHPDLREIDGRLRREHQVDAASQRQPALPRPQTLTSQMHRHQRRRTRRIHRDARAVQPQHIRQPAGRDAECVTGPEISIDSESHRPDPSASWE